MQGLSDTVQILLDDDVDATLGLTDAVWGLHTDIVNRLQASGATYNGDATNTEALVLACENGHLDTVKVLLDAAADPLACRREGMKWACSNGAISSTCHGTFSTATTHV
jgi:ankyrin repeat protein